MGKFSDFVDRLFPQGSPDTDDVFKRVDITKEVARFKPEKSGAERGQQTEPSGDSDTLDPVELQITSHFTDLWQTASQRYHEYVSTYRRRLDLAVDMSGNVEEVAIGTVGDFEAIAKEAALNLYAPRQRVVETDADYWRFRDRNRLERRAVPRKSQIFNIGVILLALVAESALNGTFLAEVFGGALLVAFLFAVGISAINVLGSVLCGIFSRYVQHTNLLKRLLGLLAIAIFLGWLASYNLFVGHFRDAAESLEWEAALVESVQRFIAAPHRLENFQSWMLALLGGLISIVVFIKGVFWDDFYPGFGGMERRRGDEQQLYKLMAEAAIEEVGRVRSDSRSDLQVARERLLTGLSETTMILTEQSVLSVRYFDYHQHVEDAANHVLGLYREANMRARPQDASKPKHFGAAFRLPKPRKLEGVGNVEGSATQLKTTFDEALSKARRSIEDAYRETLATISRFEDLNLRSET
ncbi:MAG: hypothetical protein ABJI96_16785 [Paracoccaceae bacterium]